MKFAGFLKNSFIDYPNEVAAIVFTLGCNFNCWYCHNKNIIEENKYNKPLIDEEEILTFLQNRKDFIDGLVISGGEPTIHGNDLRIFIKKVKELGFKVKLDTNGTNPELVKELIDEKLIDFVAMDIKTSPEKYNKLIGRDLCFDNLKKTIDILIKSKISYEFRTTFSPDVTIEDIEKIAKMIFGAKSYIIQKYNPVGNDLREPHSLKDFNLAKEKIKDIVNCSLRI